MAGHSRVVPNENLASRKYIFCPQAVFEMGTNPKPLHMKLKIGEKRPIISVGDFFSAVRLFFRHDFSAPAGLIGQRAGVKLKFSWCARILSKSVH